MRATERPRRAWPRGRVDVADAGVYVGSRDDGEVWLTREESLLVFGASGEGKTLRLLVPLCRRLRGPVVTLTTKEDLLRELACLPETAGRPLWVVDFRGRTGLDGLPLAPLGLRRSGFDLVAGCEHSQVARLRAKAVVEVAYDSSTVRDGGVWKARAVSLVTYILHAAALLGEDAGWVVSAVTTARFDEVRSALQRSPAAVPLWDELVDHVQRLPDETRGGVLFGAAAGLAPLSDHPDLLELCSGRGLPQVDVDQLLDDEGLLFIITSDERRLDIAPLAAAFVESVVGAAKARAQRRPLGRLDPPLALVVDEMARCPLPTAQELAATGRSQGITPVFVWQNPAQVRRAYGEAGAAELLDAMTAVLFMRGLRDPGDLAMVERWMPEVVRWSESRSAERLGRPSRTLTERREPAMSASDIRRLAEGEALLFVRGLAPVDVRLRGPWELDRRQRAVHAHAERRYDSAVAARRGR